MGVAARYRQGAYRANEWSLEVADRRYPGDGSRIGVLIPHGAGGSAATNLPAKAPLVDAGYPVLYADYGGAETYANDTAMAAMQDAKAYLQAPPPNGMGAKPGKVFLAGGSMGALLGIRFALDYPTEVAGLFGTTPPLDLEDIRTNDRGGGPASDYIKTISALDTSAGGSTTVYSIPSVHAPIAVGQHLVLVIGFRSVLPGPITAADTKGNVWAVVDVSGTSCRCVVAYAYVGTALQSTDKVTVTHPVLPGTDPDRRRTAIFMQFAGGGTSTAEVLDASATAFGTGTQASVQVAATATQVDLVVGAVAVGLPSARDVNNVAGWSIPSTNANVDSTFIRVETQFLLVPAGGPVTYNPTIGFSSDWAAVAVAFKKGGGFRDNVDTAWGVTYPTPIPSRGNPIARTAEFVSAGLVPKSRFYYSTNDTIVVPQTCLDFAAATGVDMRSLGDVGHSTYGIDPYDVVGFFDSLGGRD